MHDAETQKNVDMVNLNAELSHACSKGDVTTVDTTDDGGAILSRPQFWFIGVVANRREQKIAHRIGEEFADVEAYVPVRKEMRTWSRGRKREIEKVVIPAKVFIHSTENQRISILKSNLGLTHFFMDAARSTNKYGGKQIAIVPDYQMQQLKLMLASSPEPVEFSEVSFAKGDKVRVTSGPLEGLEGIVNSDANGSTRIFIIIEALGCASTEIGSANLEKL